MRQMISDQRLQFLFFGHRRVPTQWERPSHGVTYRSQQGGHIGLQQLDKILKRSKLSQSCPMNAIKMENRLRFIHANGGFLGGNSNSY